MEKRLTVHILCILAGSFLLSAQSPPPSPPPPASGPAPRTAEIELQRKLDMPFTLSLQKIELAEAFKQIAGAGGIALQVDPACYDALPYGATTRVTADFRESKLRDAIEQVLVPLCLEQVVSSATIIIRPTAPLTRIGRRADWDELKLLQALRTGGDLKNAAGPFEWTAALRSALDGYPHLAVSMPIAATPEAAALNDKAIEQLKKQFPLSPFRALELYCQLTNQIWFVETPPPPIPGGGTVRIMPERRWVERQLARPIQLSFTNAPLEQIITALSHTSGIRFTPEPGLYQAFPLVTLNSNNASVLQTIEFLSGNSGIAFDIRDDSVHLRLANSPAPPAPTARADRIVARIAVPIDNNGLTMDILVYESDLPADLNELRKKKLQTSIEALQKMTKPE
ncbi:MAG: hypothetical protein FWD53_11830 [Phycisphaerales bacterium]|nr:hypothetical protein [Phycisphaerales bacterium]